MVRGGVGAGVAAPQHRGEALAGRVEIGHQRMEPVSALVGPRGGLLVRMGVHQRGVDVDHIEPRIGSRGPHRGAGLSTGRLDLPDAVPGRLEGPPQRRRRRHLTEQPRLGRHRGDVTDRVAAVGDHHRRIHQHPPPVMAPTALLGPRHRHRQRRRQPHIVGQIRQQPRPGMNSQPASPAGEPQTRTGTDTLHHESALLCAVLRVLQPQDCHIRRAFPRHSHPNRPPLLKDLG